MHAFRPFIFTSLCIQSALATRTRSQYCYSSIAEPSSFCVAFSQMRNQTSQGTDLYLAFSALPTSSGRGWSAIGVGDVMAGSLMFIMWADEKRENLAVSLRTASAHTEPFPTSELPRVDILGTEASKEGSHEVSLVCYSCDGWTSLDFQDTSQPWIWASNYYAEFKTIDPDQYIGSHQLHDIFYVDMTAVPSKETFDGGSRLPHVEGLANSGTWDRHSSPSKSTSFGMGFWHGSLMLAAFMGTLLPSAIYKRWKPNTKYHMQCQILGSGLTIIGLAFGLSVFKSSASSIGSHQILGLVVSCMIILQILLGAQILHYQQQRSLWSYRRLHRWLGRCVLMLGILDIGLGLALAGNGLVAFSVWSISSLAEIAVYGMAEPGTGSGILRLHHIFLFRRWGYAWKMVPLSDENEDLRDLVDDEESVK